MGTKTKRNIVKIDEEKCNGCSACIIACAEGALEIRDGKARLVSEKYCDGLGNCLDCPQGAISIEQRDAEEFDEQAVEQRLKDGAPAEKTGCLSCPSARIMEFGAAASPDKPVAETAGTERQSRLNHWPVQLTLVPPIAPFLKNADLVLTADCVPCALAGFHETFLGEGKALIIACPKLDNFQEHQEKLNQILKVSGIRSLTVVHMEVPCCSGLVHMAQQAVLSSGNVVPFRNVTISVRGEIVSG